MDGKNDGDGRWGSLIGMNCTWVRTLLIELGLDSQTSMQFFSTDLK